MTNENIKAVHIVEVKFHGPTNTKGARVGIKSLRFGDRVIVDYDYSVPSISGTAGTAINWLQDHGFTVTGIGEAAESYMVVVEEFHALRGDNS